MFNPTAPATWPSPITLPLAHPGLRGLPEPRALVTWWLAVALLTWVQLRHDQSLPLPLLDPAWQGVVALALSVTVVSSMAGRASLERVLLLIGAWALATHGGAAALLPLASVSAAFVAAHAHETSTAPRALTRWRDRLGPCLLALCGLAAWDAGTTPRPIPFDPAAPALATLVFVGVLVLARFHRRECQGPGGSVHAGPIAAVTMVFAAGLGALVGDLAQAVSMILALALWLPLLLAAHLPSENPANWWFRRAAVTLSACALGCWASLSLSAL